MSEYYNTLMHYSNVITNTLIRMVDKCYNTITTIYRRINIIVLFATTLHFMIHSILYIYADIVSVLRIVTILVAKATQGPHHIIRQTFLVLILSGAD